MATTAICVRTDPDDEHQDDTAHGPVRPVPRPREATSEGVAASLTAQLARRRTTVAASSSQALVESARDGSIDAFGELYGLYGLTVYKYIRHRVGEPQVAQDLTQDTFVRALRRIGAFQWQGRDIGAWLVTIARNLVADHYKSGRYRFEVVTGDVTDCDEADQSYVGHPEASVEGHLVNITLLTAVKELNPEQQECIVLRFLSGYNVAETARIMGKNPGAIKALQYRAVQTLRRLLPIGFEP